MNRSTPAPPTTDNDYDAVAASGAVAGFYWLLGRSIRMRRLADGAVAIRDVLELTVSVDHNVVDGAPGCPLRRRAAPSHRVRRAVGLTAGFYGCDRRRTTDGRLPSLA